MKPIYITVGVAIVTDILSTLIAAAGKPGSKLEKAQGILHGLWVMVTALGDDLNKENSNEK